MTQVTARDFRRAVKLVETEFGPGIDIFVTDERFDALLSQVRAQAASEKEDEMRRYMEEKIKEAKEIVRAQAHAEGRREGLKEMDEAWESATRYEYDIIPTSLSAERLIKLRQEYQSPA